jgi:hypothetical protein
MKMPPTVDLIHLKRFAAERMTRGSTLREILLQEDDELEKSIFLSRLGI